MISNFPPMLLRLLTALAAVVCFVSPASGEDTPAPEPAGARWYLQTSYYTKHFHSDPAHNNHQHLVNLERIGADNALVGGAFFYNSFDQPTEYVYVGKLWRPFDRAPLVHFKLTGGLIHGYKQDYRDKIPYNQHGIAPAILPAIGISGKNFATEAVFFGIAGVMLTAGFYWQ